MRSMRGRAALGALGAILAVLVIGCGGGDDGGDDGGGGGGGEGASAEQYVDDVCSGLNELTTTVEDGQAELQQALTGAVTSPEEGRDVLVDFLADAADAADDARVAVEDAGVPDVDGGEDVADAINTAVADMQQAFAQARDDAEGMSVASPGEFATDAEGIANAVRESSGAIQDSLEAVGENAELEAAAEDSEDCQEL